MGTIKIKFLELFKTRRYGSKSKFYSSNLTTLNSRECDKKFPQYSKRVSIPGACTEHFKYGMPDGYEPFFTSVTVGLSVEALTRKRKQQLKITAVTKVVILVTMKICLKI